MDFFYLFVLWLNWSALYIFQFRKIEQNSKLRCNSITYFVRVLKLRIFDCGIMYPFWYFMFALRFWVVVFKYEQSVYFWTSHLFSIIIVPVSSHQLLSSEMQSPVSMTFKAVLPDTIFSPGRKVWSLIYGLQSKLNYLWCSSSVSYVGNVYQMQHLVGLPVTFIMVYGHQFKTRIFQMIEQTSKPLTGFVQNDTNGTKASRPIKVVKYRGKKVPG